MDNQKLYRWKVTHPDGRTEDVFYPLADANGILYNAPRISEELEEFRHFSKEISIGLQSDIEEYLELSENLPPLKDYSAIFAEELQKHREEKEAKGLK